MTSNSKFMVGLLGAISSKHLFAIAFVGISAFFALLMVGSYRRSVRRNFRPNGDRPRSPALVDARRLPGGDGPHRKPEKRLGR
jgi:hypothetical protein